MANAAIHEAGSRVGTLAALASALGVTPAAVSEWGSGRRPVPIERCVQIERITAGAVTRIALRPDDWDLIWPELAEKHQTLAVKIALQRKARAERSGDDASAVPVEVSHG